MFLIKLVFIIVEFANANAVRIICDNATSNKKDKSFTLVAKLDVNNETQNLNTKAIITLHEDTFKTGPQIINSQGFYRYVNALGGYKHAILIPTEESSRILSMNLKINIQSPLQSSIELDETEKYFSNCRTL